MQLATPLRPAAVLAALALTASPTQAQDATWAITNARIETVTRGVIEGGTIVIRDGLIEAVGTNVRVPADARVLDLTGRTVSPGLIDLTTSMGLPTVPAPAGGRFAAMAAAQQQQQQQPEFTGLDARRNVSREVRLSNNDARGARENGITAVLVAPSRGAFRGQSALVPMRDNFETRMIVRAPVAMHMGFEGTPGRYPGTLLGVQAYQRQSLYEAQRHGLIRDAYDRGARGMARPDHDADLEALVPVVRGQMPVFFAASSENEIRRAVRTGKEFDLDLAIVGATEGFRAVDALRQARAVVVSVDFPRPTSATGWSYRASLQRSVDDSAATDSAVQRLLEGNAAALHRAGIRVALASGSLGPSEFLVNVRKTIAAGLPADAALQALTIRPAQIAGAGDRLGSIEAGKIANLVVSNGPLLADTARVLMVFVDGRRYVAEPASRTQRRGRGADAAAPDETVVARVAGIWSMIVTTPQSTHQGTLNVRQDGGRIDGNMDTELGTVPIADGTVSGSTVRWTITIPIEGQATTISFRGNVEGNRMTGNADLGPLGAATFTAERHP